MNTLLDKIWSYRKVAAFDKVSHFGAGYILTAVGEKLIDNKYTQRSERPSVQYVRQNKYSVIMSLIVTGFTIWEAWGQKYLPASLNITSISARFDGVYDWLAGVVGGGYRVFRSKLNANKINVRDKLPDYTPDLTLEDRTRFPD